MSDTNVNNNDKKLPAKGDSALLESTTNRDSSTPEPEAMSPHDEPDELEKGTTISALGSCHTVSPSGKLRLAEGRPFIREEVVASEEDANEEVATPSTGTPGVGMAGTISISSWEAHFPETDEQSEPAVEPAVGPGAFPVPGVHPSRVNDDFTVTDHDSTLPAPEIPVTAHAVNEDEENLMRQELHELRAMVDHAVVANVAADDEHSIVAKWTTKKQALFIVAGAVVLLAIVLGILLPLVLKKRAPTLAPTPQPTPIPDVWTQIGDDLVGEADGDYFGYSLALSGDGSILAVGAPFNDGNGDGSGSVRVYQQNVNGTTPAWTRLGGDIDGANAGDEFGWSVSLSDDGNILAVGADQYATAGDPPGYIRIFQLVNDEWTLIGDAINGRSMDDEFGYSVALSADGTIVAGGAWIGDYTLVYQFQNGNWNQLGSDIVGDAESVSLSHDGAVLAVGDDDTNIVRVYRFMNNDWTIIGSPIAGSGSFGWSVSLSADGRMVAVGAPFNDGNDSTDSDRGAAYVYQNVNDEWIQVGSALYGANAYDEFGTSVSLSNDGTVLAVGAWSNGSNGEYSGQVRVFQFVNNDWRPIGNPINGRGVGDEFGISVALSADGTIVAGGTDQTSSEPGYVLVHRLEEQ